MSWWDDIVGSIGDVGSSIGSSVGDFFTSPGTMDVVAAVVPSGTSNWYDDLFGDSSNWFSGDQGSSTTDWLGNDTTSAFGNMLSTPSAGYDTLGLDNLMSQLGANDTNSYDPTLGMMTNPVATSQLWDKLNTSDIMGVSPSGMSGSTASLLDKLLATESAMNSDGSLSGALGSGFAVPSTYDIMSRGDLTPQNIDLPGSSPIGDFGSGLSGVSYDDLVGTASDGSAPSWLTSALASLGKKAVVNGMRSNKTNLQQGIGTLGGLASMYAALQGGNTSAAPSVNQIGTKNMTWVKPKKMAGGGATGGVGKLQGALGLLRGASPGQQDNVPINGSHGEYMMDADTVSALGDGNTDAGAAKLDKMRQNIRRHKRAAPPSKIPPKAKTPEAYMAGAK